MASLAVCLSGPDPASVPLPAQRCGIITFCAGNQTVVFRRTLSDLLDAGKVLCSTGRNPAITISRYPGSLNSLMEFDTQGISFQNVPDDCSLTGFRGLFRISVPKNAGVIRQWIKELVSFQDDNLMPFLLFHPGFPVLLLPAFPSFPRHAKLTFYLSLGEANIC